MSGPDLSWTEAVSDDVVEAMSPVVRRFFVALRRLHEEGEDGGD